MKLRKLEELLLNVSEAHYQGIYIDGGQTDEGIYGTIADENGAIYVEYWTAEDGNIEVEIHRWDNRIAEMVEASGI